MNENENNFEALRQLLALKQHEVPPPGYFEHFSGQVIAQIRAEQRGQSTARAVELPWLFRLLAVLESKPVFAGGFASALCALLVLGVVYAERPDATPLMPAANLGSSPLAAITTASLNPTPMTQVAAPAEQVVWASSTNPVFNVPSGAGLFDSQPATAQLASFRFQ